MSNPLAGADYPGSFGEFEAWFATDADCLDYLDWLRWPNGFMCPRCGTSGGWKLGDGRWMCSSCSHRTSITAGTIFHGTQIPLTIWFTACWHFATAKNGISALALQRAMQLGSYQSAWAMLHRFRSVLSQPGRRPLAGIVEIDETFIGGHEPGLAGGRARGKKVLVCVAIEVLEPRGFGRCRMTILADASAASLHPFVRSYVAPGSTVVTDGWSGYRGIQKYGFVLEQRSQRAAAARGEDPGGLLPGVHRVAALTKRWLLGTHQGAVRPEHLASYLDEFVFRFNRRGSRNRGLLFHGVIQLAVHHRPVRYQDLIEHRRPREEHPTPPPKPRISRSLERPRADRPWRHGHSDYSG